MSKYDIIIIGSGLGGLECGAILSKGLPRLCWRRKQNCLAAASNLSTRHQMDTGIHYIGSLDEGKL